ncbi:NosD domain-containing protein, partial [Candidatus Eisenbacteria bacterium]
MRRVSEVLAILMLTFMVWASAAMALPNVANDQAGGDGLMEYAPGQNLTGYPGGSMFPNQDPNYVLINLTNNGYGDNQPFPEGYYIKYAGFNSDGTRISVSARNQIGGVSQVYEIWVMDYDATTQTISNFQQITSNGGVGDVFQNGMPAWSRTDPDLLLYCEIHMTTANLVKTYDLGTSTFTTLYDPSLDTNGFDATNPGWYDTDNSKIIVGSGYTSGNDRILLFDGTYPSTTISSSDQNLDPASNYAGDRVTYYSTNSAYPYPAGSIYTAYSGGVWTEQTSGFGDPSTGDVPGVWAFYSGMSDDEILSLRSDLGWTATGLGLYASDGTLISDLLGDGGTDFQWVYANHNWKGPNGEILFRAEEYSHSGYGTNMFIAMPFPTVVYVDDDWTGPGDCGGHAWGYDAFATIQDGIDGVGGSTVNVAPGLYEEQLVITTSGLTLIGSGSGSDPASNTIVKSPVSLTYFFNNGTNDNYPVIGIDGVTGVTIQDLRLDGAGRGNGNSRFCGIGFWNAGGAVTDCYVIDVRDTPFSGAQHGVGIYAYNDTGGPYTISVTGTPVEGFQKTGIALGGADLTANVSGCDVTGYGATGTTAQNGIQIGFGAGGTITDCSVSDIAYTGDGWIASGMLFFEASTVDVNGSCTATNCQVSVVYRESQGSVDGIAITTGGVVSEEGISIRDWGYAKLAEGEMAPVASSPLAESVRGGDSPLGATTTSVDISDATLTGVHYAGSYGIAVWSLGDNVISTITGCSINDWEYGVVVYEDVSVADVDFLSNTVYGNDIGLWGNSSSLIAYSNQFYGNGVNAQDDGPSANQWNHSSCPGNYWDDFVSNSGYSTQYNLTGTAMSIDDCPLSVGVTLDPPTHLMKCSETIVYHVNVGGNALDLMGADYELNYPDTKLSFVSATVGDLLNTGAGEYIFAYQLSPGVIHINSSHLTTGVNGPGTIAEVTFTSIG